MKTKLNSAFIMMFLLGIGACSNDDDYQAPVLPDLPTVSIAEREGHGNILITNEGFSLYVFAFDANGEAGCNDGCAAAWPPYYSETLTLGEGLDEANFGEIERTDGTKQITFKGWPVYEFANDAVPGDVNGDGLGGVWHAAKPNYALMIGAFSEEDQVRRYLTDPSGNTLYNFLQDSPGESKCLNGCAEVWPAFEAVSAILPSSIAADDLSSFIREDDQSQSTFKDFPMYFFINDENRGDRNGTVANDQFILFGDPLFLDEL